MNNIISFPGGNFPGWKFPRGGLFQGGIFLVSEGIFQGEIRSKENSPLADCNISLDPQHLTLNYKIYIWLKTLLKKIADFYNVADCFSTFHKTSCVVCFFLLWFANNFIDFCCMVSLGLKLQSHKCSLFWNIIQFSLKNLQSAAFWLFLIHEGYVYSNFK